MRHALAVLLALAASAPVARAESLAELLAAVSAGARFDPPARADVRIESAAGPARAILVGRGDVVYVEVKDGLRALVAPAGIVVAGGERGTAAAARRLAGSDVLLEDLAVFRPAALAFPQISDDGPTGVVVTSAPAGPSNYALLVYTIDREKRAIVKTQYYTGTVGNLGKLRRDTLVRIGEGWRPSEITVDAFQPPSTTRLTLAWRAAPDVPASLFEPGGLERPSGLTFD